jgi:CubicO group peptidase (beta-lactamase class C family)
LDDTVDTNAALRALQDPDRLRALLAKAVGPLRVKRALVGVATPDCTALAVAGSDIGVESTAAVAEPFRIRIGCLVKLLTATLVLEAVAAGDLDLDARALDYLPDIDRHSRPLQHVTLRHLLEHTHGIDDSLMGNECPRQADRIDVHRLSEYIAATPPLSPAGERYSYSQVGCLLLGAVLEQRFDDSYGRLVARLLEPLGIHPGDSTGPSGAGAPPISPAFEAHWLLSAQELLRIVGHCARVSFGPARTVTALPGWSPIERGICVGWKSYGDDWFGHASDLRGHLTIVKAFPATGTVLLASTGDYAPSAILSAVFGAVLPRSHQVRLPRLLSPAERRGLELNPYVAEFENAALRIAVRPAGEGTVMVSVMDRRPDRRDEAGPAEIHSKALPARDDLFVCQSAAGDFALLQFVLSQPRGFGYLWNGRSMFRRSPITGPC